MVDEVFAAEAGAYASKMLVPLVCRMHELLIVGVVCTQDQLNLSPAAVPTRPPATSVSTLLEASNRMLLSVRTDLDDPPGSTGMISPVRTSTWTLVELYTPVDALDTVNVTV
jgi:hypothetical protein